MSTRTLVVFLTVLLLAPLALPLAASSTEQTFNGDVIINGAFRNAQAMGHPAKANDPTSSWVAFDWVGRGSTSPPTNATFVVGEDGGITITKTSSGAGDASLEQYFNGSFATARAMQFYGFSVTASAPEAGTYLTLQLRHRDAGGANLVASKSISLSSTPTLYSYEPADLGLANGQLLNAVSVRLLTSQTDKPVVIERVSAYMTNGVEGRNILINAAGDDYVTATGEAVMQSAGIDGKFSWFVAMADDAGEPLPTKDALLCIFDAQSSVEDGGYPAYLPSHCAEAYMDHAHPAITRTQVGDGFRFDVDADAIRPERLASGAFSVYATVKVDGSYDVETPGASSEYKSGYFHVARSLADDAGVGVSNEFYGPTPIFADANNDHVPDVVGSMDPRRGDLRYDGDVVINGQFQNTLPAGAPQKVYAQSLADNAFVAYDWTMPSAVADRASFPSTGGLRIANVGENADTPFIQQHFAGSDAPDKQARFYGAEIAASATNGTVNLRFEIRTGEPGGSAVSHSKRVSVPPGGATTAFIAPSDLGMTSGSLYPLRSVRVWMEGPGNATIHRVSVFATNGVEPRGTMVVPAGDDEIVQRGATVMQQPGADGVFSWFVSQVDDLGTPMKTDTAELCIYEPRAAYEDLYNWGQSGCANAILTLSEARAHRVADGLGFRFDVPAGALGPAATDATYVVWAAIKIDDATHGALTAHDTDGDGEVWDSGFYNVGQQASRQVGAGAANGWETAPTLVVFDRDGNGAPDAKQSDDTDGFAAIILPRGVATPAVTVVEPDATGDYVFDVRVYAYDGALGEPIGLRSDASDFVLTLFDGEAIANAPTGFWKPDGALWESTASDVTALADGETYRVRVPASEVVNATLGGALVGAWAWYDVDRASGNVEGVTGTNDPASDFYSSIQSAAAGFATGDALRNHATPILLAPATGLKIDVPTILVRIGENENFAPVPGGLAIADADNDTMITLEYAVIRGDGETFVPSDGFDGHGLAIYDAAGAASDSFAPGTSRLEHAEFVGTGAAVADGWFAIDVPLSALSNAKGPLGAYVWVDENAIDLHTYTWFSTPKAIAADVSSGAAEAMRDLVTPLVLTETSLNLPTSLLNALTGLPGLASLQNPVVNPGFELDLLVEGTLDNSDGASGTMTTPPWFFRLDDVGGTRSTNPYSTHEVVAGGGLTGGNALLVNWDQRDRDKGLMLGQLFSTEEASEAYVWTNATSVVLDTKLTQGPHYQLTAAIRYLDAEGNVSTATATTIVQSGSWKRVELTFPEKVEGQLLGLYLMPSLSYYRSGIWFDNVAIKGSQLRVGDARSDLTDGYAMIIEPRGLSGAVQGVYEGADGRTFLLYNVSAMSYAGGASVVDVDTFGYSTFALRTQEREIGNGVTLRLVDNDTKVVGVVAIEDAPADAAVPWAFFDVAPGDAYEPLGRSEFTSEPASGYYNPVKNALRGSTLADNLDYAATPVTFDGSDVVASIGVPQQMRLAAVPGGFGVIVEADSPFVETATVIVSKPSAADESYSVVLDGAAGTMVPGLVIAAADLNTTTVESLSTLFTEGDVIAAGSPTASFDVCQAGFPGCVASGFESLMALNFTDTSIVPSQEAVTRVWAFDDGTTRTTSDAVVQKTYSRPGDYDVDLTIYTASGRTDTFTQTVSIANLAPTLDAIVSNGAIFSDSTNVQFQANAIDRDGGVLSYTWTIEGFTVPGVTGKRLTLTPGIIENITLGGSLVKGPLTVTADVVDGQGGSATKTVVFIVQDHATVASAPAVTVPTVANASYAVVGETILVEGNVSDADNLVTSVTALFDLDGDVTAVALSGANAPMYQAQVTGLAPGLYNVTIEAVDDAAQTHTSPTIAFRVAENQAPVAAIEGDDLVQALSNVTLTANASDPDGRGIESLEWFVDGNYTASGAEFVYEPGNATGAHVITLRATDANGGVTETSRTIGVDDVIVVDVQIDATDVFGDIVVTVTVTDEAGNAIEGATVLYEDRFAVLPVGLVTGSTTTDANGTASWTISPIGPIQLPGEHTLVIDAFAPSHAGAADEDDIEAFHAEIPYDVGLLP